METTMEGHENLFPCASKRHPDNAKHIAQINNIHLLCCTCACTPEVDASGRRACRIPKREKRDTAAILGLCGRSCQSPARDDGHEVQFAESYTYKVCL